MAYSAERLNIIYDRTCGACHLCRKKLAFKNYGKSGTRRAWEVEHSKPRAKGGTDHGNNLYAACIPCNRSKNSGSTRMVRARNGYKCAPYSEDRKITNAVSGATALGILAALLVPPQVRIPAMLIAGLVGGMVGYDEIPD